MLRTCYHLRLSRVQLLQFKYNSNRIYSERIDWRCQNNSARDALFTKSFCFVLVRLNIENKGRQLAGYVAVAWHWAADSAPTSNSSKDGLRRGSCDQHLTSKLDMALDLQNDASQREDFFFRSTSRTSSDRLDKGCRAALYISQIVTANIHTSDLVEYSSSSTASCGSHRKAIDWCLYTK